MRFLQDRIERKDRHGGLVIRARNRFLRAATARNLSPLLAPVFVFSAMVLGGGGSPEPAAEIALQLLFVLVATMWVWSRYSLNLDSGSTNIAVVLLLMSILAVPLLQLLPLPPEIWSSLPGREGQFAALALIGEESSWRPISISPHRTLASLLAIVPAVFCLYMVASMNLEERRLVLVAIVGATIASLVLGIVQLASVDRVVSIYANLNPGFFAGFQANRNSTADVLLIGFLALSALAAPQIFSNSRHALGTSRWARPGVPIILGLSLLLLLATMVTGSRTGTALIPLALGGSSLIYFQSMSNSRVLQWRKLHVALVVAAAAAVGMLVWLTFFTQVTTLDRVASRFLTVDLESRLRIWQDSWFAMKQYWPFGFGLGGFEPAMYAAERLEFLDATRPNRAHNDFLEFMLEAGALGLASLLFGICLMLILAVRAWRDSLEMRPYVAFSLTSLLLIGLHSIVDYPLRSMSLACLAGAATGLLAIPQAKLTLVDDEAEPDQARGNK